MSMGSGNGTTIAGLGHYAPERVVSSAELEARLGLDDGFIAARTGILERRWAADGEALSDLAIAAGDRALVAANVARDDVALTLLATSTPDHLLPPTAPLVAHRLGLTRAGAVDVTGACAGFLYALALADGLVRALRRPVLIIAANILSRRIDMNETASAVLFADAAGAAVLAPTTRADSGLVGVDLASDGGAYDLIKIPGGGSRSPYRPEMGMRELTMKLSEGPVVFAKAVEMMAGTAAVACARASISIGDVDRWIPHQANARLIEATRKRIGLAPEKLATSVARYGNSSAATIPLTLSLAAAQAPLREGELVLMSAAGAGLTGGSLVFRV